jgi:hypothetical protein
MNDHENCLLPLCSIAAPTHFLTQGDHISGGGKHQVCTILQLWYKVAINVRAYYPESIVRMKHIAHAPDKTNAWCHPSATWETLEEGKLLRGWSSSSSPINALPQMYRWPDSVTSNGRGIMVQDWIENESQQLQNYKAYRPMQHCDHHWHKYLLSYNLENHQSV